MTRPRLRKINNELIRFQGGVVMPLLIVLSGLCAVGLLIYLGYLLFN